MGYAATSHLGRGKFILAVENKLIFTYVRSQVESILPDSFILRVKKKASFQANTRSTFFFIFLSFSYFIWAMIIWTDSISTCCKSYIDYMLPNQVHIISS